ncbi:MAG: LysR family transcriptional regulator [Myxococcales bacterium]|nr:MAG: LysR family transcriptional regulator [Myxococcales bacterium]
MGQLNYQHLQYFWTVAREGSIVGASKVLHVSSPTISVQINQLESLYGHELLLRQGRSLRLTEKGHAVFKYADTIFRTGDELEKFLMGQPAGAPAHVDIGITPVFPKTVTWKLLQPILNMTPSCTVTFHEANQEALLNRLLGQQLDFFISDTTVDSQAGLKLHNHSLGESDVIIMGSSKLARRYRRNFPNSLNGAPFLLPTSGNALRRAMDNWFDNQRISVRVVADFDDYSLLKTAGAEGYGLFPFPSIVKKDAKSRFGAEQIGCAQGVVEKFYCVSTARKNVHPALALLIAHHSGQSTTIR